MLIATRIKNNADSDKADGESCNDYDSIDIGSSGSRETIKCTMDAVVRVMAAVVGVDMVELLILTMMEVVVVWMEAIGEKKKWEHW